MTRFIKTLYISSTKWLLQKEKSTNFLPNSNFLLNLVIAFYCLENGLLLLIGCFQKIESGLLLSWNANKSLRF
jgi:hypothetical protein